MISRALAVLLLLMPVSVGGLPLASVPDPTCVEVMTWQDVSGQPDGTVSTVTRGADVAESCHWTWQLGDGPPPAGFSVTTQVDGEVPAEAPVCTYPNTSPNGMPWQVAWYGGARAATLCAAAEQSAMPPPSPEEVARWPARWCRAQVGMSREQLHTLMGDKPTYEWPGGPTPGAIWQGLGYQFIATFKVADYQWNDDADRVTRLEVEGTWMTAAQRAAVHCASVRRLGRP